MFKDQFYLPVRAADLFLRDGTRYDEDDVTSNTPVALRALTHYDMDLDPVGQGYAAAGCRGFDFGRKLTRSGVAQRLEGPGAPPDTLPVTGDDPILFIERAAIFDDSEYNLGGDQQANWKVDVLPVRYHEATGTFFTGACGQLDTPIPQPFPGEPWYYTVPGFRTKLRGPFWTGEKFEVGDSDFPVSGLHPQIMHYKNLGVWNWNWCPAATAVILRIWEGDAGIEDDDVAFIIAHKAETQSGSITISDTGDLVELSITGDGRLRRRVLDGSGHDPDKGWPRIFRNPDTHNIDVTLRTSTFNQLEPSSGQTFAERYGFAGNQVRGHRIIDDSPGFLQARCLGVIRDARVELPCGESSFHYIDNISLIGGWDCSFSSNDLADYLAFDIDPAGAGFATISQTVNPFIGVPECEDKMSLFLRSTILSLPAEVLVSRRGPIQVEGGTRVVVDLPRRAGYDGFAFSEFLTYDAHHLNDDLGLRIAKSVTDSTYRFEVETLYGGGGSVRVRFNAIEWPRDVLAADISRAVLDTRGAGEDGFRVRDLRIPDPEKPYFTIHELLTYAPADDNDMGWMVSQEALPDRVTFSLAQGAGNANAYLESEALVVQFRDIAPPSVSCGSPVRVECDAPGGVAATHPSIQQLLQSATAKDNCDESVVVVNDAPSFFRLGETRVRFCATDSAGNAGCCEAIVTVVDTQAPTVSVNVTPEVLWPPNHKFVEIRSKVRLCDICDATPTFELLSIGNNEAVGWRGERQLGEGVEGAEFGTPDTTFSLRAERRGSGDGRRYDIAYAGKDGSGNVAEARAAVKVPRSRGGHAAGQDSTGTAPAQESASVPSRTRIVSARPNPFEASMAIVVDVAVPGEVQLDVLSVTGEIVRTLVREPQGAGQRIVSWDGVDNRGRKVSPGVYYLRLSAGAIRETRKTVRLSR